MSEKLNNIVVACPDEGEGADPEALGLAFHHQGPHSLMHVVKLLQIWLIETEVICLSQGGLRSQSTPSS